MQRFRSKWQKMERSGSVCPACGQPSTKRAFGNTWKQNMSQATATTVPFVLSSAPQRMPGTNIKVNSTRGAEI